MNQLELYKWHSAVC